MAIAQHLTSADALILLSSFSEQRTFIPTHQHSSAADFGMQNSQQVTYNAIVVYAELAERNVVDS